MIDEPPQPPLEEVDELPEDFEVEENEDGSAKVLPKESAEPQSDKEFYANLVEDIDHFALSSIATDFLEHIEIDKESRKLRDKQYAEAIQRSGLGNDAPGGAEFEGASKVVHPLITEAAIDFASTAIKELFPAAGPVRTKIEGKVTPKKLQKADRKQRHMNWQARKQIIEFRPALEQILTQVPMGGVQYSKMYYWERARRPKFEFVPLDDIYVPYHAPNFYAATRKTHRQRLNMIEFEERVSSGLYHDPEVESDKEITDGFTAPESESEKASDKVEGKENPHYDEDGLRTVYEIYCFLELEEDSFVENEYKHAPYILTIDGPTEKVLAIYRNWDPEQKTYEALDWIVEWPFIPWRGAYAIGLSQIIGSISAAATGALRALLDSAHINNSPTAIKLKGAQLSGQSANISVTQIHEIDAAPGVDDIRKIAMPLPFNPPSTVLFQLLGFLVDAGKGVVRTVVESNPDYSPNIAPGTQLNLIEQGLKVYSAIHARMHESMDRTLAILHRLNGMYLEDGEAPEDNEDHALDMVDEENDQLAYRSDYLGEMDVQPVSDPNIFSESQRFAQMTAVGQLVEKYPQLYDVRAYNKCMLQLMKLPNIEELLPEPQQNLDENPVTENIKMATGAVAGVLPDQDHLAHIQVHMDFMMDPMYGQNPVIKPTLAGQWVSHMLQHMLMLYGSEVKQLIEEASGGKKIKDLLGDSPEIREALSKAAAAASPIALESTRSLLEKIMPVLQDAMSVAQQNQLPQPMDPSAAQLQVAQLNAQTKKAEMEHSAQIEQIKLQANDQLREKELIHEERIKQLEAALNQQLKDREIEANAQIEGVKVASTENIEHLRAKVELQKNQEDNITALKLAAMRVAEGRSFGNLKNGTSIDQNFKEGGLVRAAQAEEPSGGINISLDMNPVAEAIRNFPQPDFSPITGFIERTSGDLAALKSSAAPVINVDLAPLQEEFKTQSTQMQDLLSIMASQNEELKTGLSDHHKSLLETIKKRPKIKLELARDDNNKLVGKIEPEDDEPVSDQS